MRHAEIRDLQCKARERHFSIFPRAGWTEFEPGNTETMCFWVEAHMDLCAPGLEHQAEYARKLPNVDLTEALKCRAILRKRTRRDPTMKVGILGICANPQQQRTAELISPRPIEAAQVA